MGETSEKRLSEEKETNRMEAFSDGVFAFAITLLVINLKDPGVGTGNTLLQGLLNEWPVFFAFFTSFVTILIMWINHHNMFNFIKRIDARLMFLNGMLLLFVVLTPFTTVLAAAHLLFADAQTAAAIYAGNFLILAVVWNGLWWYSSKNLRLMGAGVTVDHARQIRRQYYVGPTFYMAALVAAYFSALASVAIVLFVAGFFAVTVTQAK